MQKYEEHELASILPMMSDADLKELAQDIKENGQRAPITLLGDKILDGRNRYKACAIAGVEPRFKDFNGNGDPLAFIISANVHRRHLTTSQRAMIAAKIESLRPGRPDKESESKVSRKQAAKELKVSPRSVATAKEVLEEATKEEVEKVERGEKTVNAVAKEMRSKAEKSKAVVEPEQPKDKTGYPIPVEILEDWQAAESFSETLKQLHKIKLTVEKAIEKGELSFREITNSTTADLKNAWSTLERVLPYAVCPTCNGRNRKKCTLCKQRGFISKFGYEQWVPKETKEIRAKSIKS